MKRHVAAETLARYRAGDLSRRRNGRVASHLASCDRCAAISGDLATVRELLATATVPAMPDHVTAQISAALAGEAARRQAGEARPHAGTVTAGQAQEPAAGRSAQHARPSARWLLRLPRMSPSLALRAAAVTAAVALLGAGGYELATRAGPVSHRAPSAAVVSGRAIAGVGPTLHYQRSGHSEDFTPVASSVNFTPATLDSKVHQALGQAPSQIAAKIPKSLGSMARSSGSSSARTSYGKPFENIPAATLEGCVSRVASGAEVLLVDLARYQGTAATIIVTETSSTSAEQVWVVGRGCSSASPDVLAHRQLKG
jgi:hypothetical protein